MSKEKPRHKSTVAPQNLTSDEKRHVYRVGYRKAADALVLRMLHEELPEIERAGLIYPIMFLYRHCIEITLKDLLELGSITKIMKENETLGHDLMKIWSNSLALTEAVQGKKMRDDFDDSFGPLISAMHAADPKGDGFRYSLDPSGQPYWPQPFDVDIVNIKMWVKAFEAWCREIESDLGDKVANG
jgi:hypothetical protein